MLKLAEQVAPTDSTVLIEGESGTGKEVVARYIHNLSERADGPFLSINCGALPENLLESELFGHVKGSFTGAVRDKQGLFAAARGGTFFLDEVGEMPPSLQIKLLRVLQEREVIPVGATEAIPVDVRIIAATNRDLEEEIRRGDFRSDLFYRLNVIALDLPPLRERRDDLLLLIECFLQGMATESGSEPKALSSEALDAVMVYDWPGNVRELENALEHAVVLSRGNLIEPQHLPERITRRREGAAGGGALLPEPGARRDRAGLHHVGAAGRGRQQDPGGGGARHRSLDPVPEAEPVRGDHDPGSARPEPTVSRRPRPGGVPAGSSFLPRCPAAPLPPLPRCPAARPPAGLPLAKSPVRRLQPAMQRVARCGVTPCE